MISFTIFGYRVNIRKERKPNPRDCRGWHRQCEEAKIKTTAAMKRVYGHRATKNTPDRTQRVSNG